MTLRPFLPIALLALLLPLAACKQADAPAPVAGGDSPAAARTAAKASTADPAALAAAEAKMREAAEQAAKLPPPVAGEDYYVIPGGQTFAPDDGRIEVVEIFGYVCPHCAAAQPVVHAMQANLPPDVRMVFVPAAFGGIWDNYGKAFYAAEALGLTEQTHDAMYRAIHIDRTLKGERGKDSPEDIAAFYAAYGADPGQFVSSMSSFAIDAKLKRARNYILNAFGDDSPGTPAFVVAGKYRVKGRSLDDVFRILNQLIVMERQARAAAGVAPATEAPATDAAPAPATQP